MDPISAFSLACGVIQVVDFGLQTLSTIRGLHKDGSTKGHQQLNDISVHMKTASLKLQEHFIRQNASSTTFTDPDDQALYDLSKKCNATASILAAELDNLTVQGTGLRRAFHVTKKTVAGTFKAGALRELQASLESYRRALDTQVLIALRSVYEDRYCNTLLFSTFDSLTSSCCSPFQWL